MPLQNSWVMSCHVYSRLRQQILAVFFFFFFWSLRINYGYSGIKTWMWLLILLIFPSFHEKITSCQINLVESKVECFPLRYRAMSVWWSKLHYEVANNINTQLKKSTTGTCTQLLFLKSTNINTRPHLLPVSDVTDRTICPISFMSVDSGRDHSVWFPLVSGQWRLPASTVLERQPFICLQNPGREK